MHRIAATAVVVTQTCPFCGARIVEETNGIRHTILKTSRNILGTKPTSQLELNSMTKANEDLEKVFREYLENIGDYYDNGVNDLQFQKAFNAFKDYLTLDFDQGKLGETVSFLMDPRGHFAMVEQFNKLAKEKRVNLKEIYEAQLEQYIDAVKLSELIQMLAKEYNVVIGETDLVALAEDNHLPRHFFNIDTSEILRPGTETYVAVQDAIKNWLEGQGKLEKEEVSEANTGAEVLSKEEVEKSTLGSFITPIERVVKSKGPNNGKTIKTTLVGEVSSDGEVITYKPVSSFIHDPSKSVGGQFPSMSIEEFKETFYPSLTSEEIEAFEEMIEVYKEAGTFDGTVYFKQARIGTKSNILRGQINLDIDIGLGNTFGFTLSKKLNDTELAALEGTSTEAVSTEEVEEGVKISIDTPFEKWPLHIREFAIQKQKEYNKFIGEADEIENIEEFIVSEIEPYHQAIKKQIALYNKDLEREDYIPDAPSYTSLEVLMFHHNFEEIFVTENHKLCDFPNLRSNPTDWDPEPGRCAN